jgi:hypothetical protein
MTESERLRLKRERDRLYQQLERTPRADLPPVVARLDQIDRALHR